MYLTCIAFNVLLPILALLLHFGSYNCTNCNFQSVHLKTLVSLYASIFNYILILVIKRNLMSSTVDNMVVKLLVLIPKRTFLFFLFQSLLTSFPFFLLLPYHLFYPFFFLFLPTPLSLRFYFTGFVSLNTLTSTNYHES